MNSPFRSKRTWWPVLLALPPLAAVIGGAATIMFALQTPDEAVAVAPVQSPVERQHVTNSVVPPLR